MNETLTIMEDSVSGMPLNTEYTFDRFTVGVSNRMAHGACKAITEKVGTLYNPLFVYGPVGLGKTHLMQSVAHQFKQDKPDMTIAYRTCEDFMNEFVFAVQKGSIQQFRNKYRQTDVLLIDDVQFLRENEQTQEEFFHVFDLLYESQKQIVLSADCNPTQMADIADRLVSRFYQGLVTRIDKPTFEMRVGIIKEKASRRHIEIPLNVIHYIARKVTKNIRQLEGALTKIQSLIAIHGVAVTMDLAREAFGESQVIRGRSISIPQIVEIVSGEFNIRQVDMQGEKRCRSVVFPRQICMYLARSLTNASFEEIGVHFGNRNHTTVMHACNKIDSLCDNDEQVRSMINGMSVTLSND